MVKLLLDENLSPSIAVALRQEGHDVVHVRDRGLLDTDDPVILEEAFSEDRVVVTVNVRDFRRFAAAREIHAGVVCVEDGGLLRAEQLELVRRVIVAVQAKGDLVNRILTVRLDGEFVIEELP